MTDLPDKAYTAAAVREMDRYAIENQGVPAYRLMCRAGQAVFDLVHEQYPDAGPLRVYCGAGNNGGDGYVVARLAASAGMPVSVQYLSDPQTLQGAAKQAYDDCVSAGVSVKAYLPSAISDGVIIDAMLGTGLQRDVEGAWKTAIEEINAATIPVIAVDIPSGIHADSGAVMNVAVRADRTVTFIGLKRGLFTGDAVDHIGEVSFDDLDIALPEDVLDSFEACDLPGPDVIPGSRRARNAHKGDHGHVVIIGGNHGMTGATQMAAMAALRTGAGLVSTAVRDAGSAIPEIMQHVVSGAAELKGLIDRADVLVIGPGMGRDKWANDLLAMMLQSGKPAVIDADALKLLAADPVRREHHVLTPHPGEAGHMLGLSTAQVQADRFQSIRDIQLRYGGVVVLKGAGSLVCGEKISICRSGNPGMASAGMGDLLSGVIAALIAQGLNHEDAARAGVCIHAMAGDLEALRYGEKGMMATDLLKQIRRLVNNPA